MLILVFSLKSADADSRITIELIDLSELSATVNISAPDAVFEVLKYCLLDRESQIFKYEAAEYFPNRLDAMNDPRIVDVPDPFYGGQKFGALLAKVAPHTLDVPSHPFLPEAMSVLRDTVPSVAAGDKTPEVALRDAAQELDDLIAQG